VSFLSPTILDASLDPETGEVTGFTSRPGSDEAMVAAETWADRRAKFLELVGMMVLEENEGIEAFDRVREALKNLDPDH
jgi:hypothetical protein